MTDNLPDAQKSQAVQVSVVSEHMVVIEHLVKQFGKLHAIDNLNMVINTGETYGPRNVGTGRSS